MSCSGWPCDSWRALISFIQFFCVFKQKYQHKFHCCCSFLPVYSLSSMLYSFSVLRIGYWNVLWIQQRFPILHDCFAHWHYPVFSGSILPPFSAVSRAAAISYKHLPLSNLLTCSPTRWITASPLRSQTCLCHVAAISNSLSQGIQFIKKNTLTSYIFFFQFGSKTFKCVYVCVYWCVCVIPPESPRVPIGLGLHWGILSLAFFHIIFIWELRTFSPCFFFPLGEGGGGCYPLELIQILSPRGSHSLLQLDNHCF